MMGLKSKSASTRRAVAAENATRRASVLCTAQAPSSSGPPPAWPRRVVVPEVKERSDPKVSGFIERNAGLTGLLTAGSLIDL